MAKIFMGRNPSHRLGISQTVFPHRENNTLQLLCAILLDKRLKGKFAKGAYFADKMKPFFRGVYIG